MRRIYIVLSCLLLVHVCNSQKQFTADELAWRIHPSDGIAYKIRMIGDIEPHLINNSSDPTISFVGNKKDLEHVNVDKNGDLIVVSKADTYMPTAPIYLIINTRNLHSIKYKGITTVYSNTNKKTDQTNNPRALLSGSIRADELSRLYTPAPSDSIIHNVSVIGDLSLYLINSEIEPTLAFTGDEEDLKKIKVEKNGEAVSITNPKDYKANGPVYLIINTKELHSVKYKGSSDINSSYVKLPKLELESDDWINIVGSINVTDLSLAGKGRIYFNDLFSKDLQITMRNSVFAVIEGKVKLTKLDMGNCAWMKLFWNESEYLKVVGKDKAFAQIAGTVGTLDIDVKEGAHFNGKFLRTKNVYARAHDNSRADIYAQAISNYFADDSGNIYNYNEPKIKFENMVASGSVLSR